jgi:hypothetical protein
MASSFFVQSKVKNSRPLSPGSRGEGQQIGNDPFKPAILFFKLPQPLHLRGQQATLFVPPIVERGFADSGLAAHLADRRTFFRLAQNLGHLRLRKLRPLPGKFLRPAKQRKLESCSSKRSKSREAGHNLVSRQSSLTHAPPNSWPKQNGINR